MISVVIPTVTGREDYLKNCIRAYEETAEDFELIVIRDRPTCGEAWSLGAIHAKGDYLHFSADDLEPHPGWWQAAVDCVEQNGLPCPRVLNPDGTLQSCGAWGEEMGDGTSTDIARVPFLSRKQWELGNWILLAHYYTDNWIAQRGLQLDIPTLVCRDYLFTHHWAMDGRYDQERMQADFEVYSRALVSGPLQ